MRQNRGPASDESRARRRWLITGIALVLLSCALGLWIFLRGNHPFDIDIWWNGLWAGVPAPVVLTLSTVLYDVGGSWVAVFLVPLGGGLLLILLRRPWSALFFVAASLLSAVAVQVLKHLFGRARPEDIIITADFGSFPSGHTANAATIAVVAALLAPRIWVRIVGGAWVVLMAFSRTYLHAHWLSDTVGGALVGAGVALLVASVLAPRILRERDIPIRRSLEPGGSGDRSLA